MEKINITFDNKNYDVDESSLFTASSALKSHLSTVMNGSGATIKFGGIPYNIDSTKLSTARNAFISHLGTVAGNGYKVVVNGVEYNVDSTKMAGAIADLHAVLGGLESGGSGDVDYGEVVLEEQELDFVYNNAMDLYLNKATLFELTEGQEYVVVWDDTEYKAICSYNEYLQQNVLGNTSLLGEGGVDTGEPFVMGLVQGKIYIFTSDTSATHTVAIYKVSGGSGETVILAYQTFEGFAYNESVGGYLKSGYSLFALQEGETYRVLWDDEQFTCVAYSHTRNGYDTIWLGNEGFVKGEESRTIEPFVIYQVLTNDYNGLIGTDTKTSHTVAIYKVN